MTTVKPLTRCPSRRQQLDQLAIADPIAATRMQRHLDGFHSAAIDLQLEKVVEEVIKALCVEVSFGRTLAEGTGRMLTTSTPENLNRYLKLVKTASGQGPTLAGIIAKHLVPVLTCKDTSIADNFEKTIRIMLKKGTYTLKAPLETLSTFVEMENFDSAHAFLELLATTYSIDLTYNRSLYLTHTLPRAVKKFGPTRRLWQIRGLTRVIQTEVRLADAYLQGLASGLDLLPSKGLDAFLDKAILRYRKDSDLGTRFLSLESQHAKDTCRGFQVAVPLSAVRSGLERYLLARTGQTVPVRTLSTWVEKMGERESNPPLVHCDGQAIYVPDEIDIMDRREDNTDLYKLLVKLEAGALEFGTYELDVEKAMNGGGIDPPHDLYNSSLPESDLARFLHGFEQPALALDLFTIFEHARIARKVKRYYPGLFRRIEQALTQKNRQIRTGHPIGGTAYPVYQYLVMDEGLPMDPSVKPVAKALIQRLDQAVKEDVNNTVETSARLTIEFYPAMTELYTAGQDSFYKALQLPFGRRLDPGCLGSFHSPFNRLATELKRQLAKRKVRVYRSNIQNLLRQQNGLVSAADIRQQFVDSADSASPGESTDVSDSDIESLICSYGLGQTASDTDDANAYRYREWDYCMDDYLPDHARVRERRIPETEPAFYRQTLALFPGMVRHIRYAFELLRPEEMTILRQWREGDDFDYRALLDYALDKKAGLMPSDRLFIKRMKRLRDVAALLLVDLSKSTANTVDGRGTRVLDVEKQAIVLLCEALQKVGDRFAIAGFSGTGPLGVDYYPVKDLNESFSDVIKGRISAMSPQRSTRMGAAIRHATARLSSVQARVKLIVILGDGFPNDLAYKGTYAVEDTRRAVMEARTEGTHVRAITVNAGDNKQLDRLYGAAHHTRIGNIQDLPGRLVRVYSALTRH